MLNSLVKEALVAHYAEVIVALNNHICVSELKETSVKVKVIVPTTRHPLFENLKGVFKQRGGGMLTDPRVESHQDRSTNMKPNR